MAINYSPRISTDSLFACLDSGNSKSFPGSGTIFYDLTGNGINGYLNGGVGFSGGAFVFDGIDDFITADNTLTSYPLIYNLYADATTTFSVTVWYKFPVSPTQARSDAVNGGNTSYAICGAGGGIGGAETFNIFVGGTNWGSAYLNTCWVGCRGSKTQISPSTINTNTWNYAAVTWNGTSGSVYHNGIYRSALNVGGAGAQGNSFTIGTIANGSTAHHFEGSISNVCLYTKSLSASEVLQNFNALKGRFSLQ